MATVHFYEKPGCANNTRQKQILSKAGHRLIVHDLLAQPWAQEPEKLRSFFGDRPVSEWFNYSAPAIKYGEVDPNGVSGQQAIELMVGDPLLIRRPLMEADGVRRAGFDLAEVEAWLGVAKEEMAGQDLESCKKPLVKRGCIA